MARHVTSLYSVNSVLGIIMTTTELNPGRDCPFDDYVFVNYCATGQNDHLLAMLEVEKRYQLNRTDCREYRKKLNFAAGIASEGDSSLKDANADWRYRIARWMLRVSKRTFTYCDWNSLQTESKTSQFQ